MLSALPPLTGDRTRSGTIQRNTRPGIRFSLLLWCLACLLALLPVIQAISSYSTGGAAVLDAFEQDLRMSLFADEESDSIHMDMHVPEDLVPSFLSLDHSARFMASASSLDAAILGEIKKVTVSNQHDEKYKVCAAIDAIQKATDDDLRKVTPGFTVSHWDKNVVLFTVTTKAGAVSDVYSYSRITGITHGSRLTQIILHVKQFHADFVAEYKKLTLPRNHQVPTVREILFDNPITLEHTGNANNKRVKIYHPQATRKAANNPVFEFPTELDAARLKNVEKFFNTVISQQYGAGNSGFAHAGNDVVELVKREHPYNGRVKGSKFNIRVNKSYYLVTKDANKDEYTFYDVGLDEIHRCMQQGVYLIRAFCNPITGEVNDRPFNETTLFAMDYMRIPTGQTLLHMEFENGKLQLSTHVTTRTPDRSYTLGPRKITLPKISSKKSPEFHALRTTAAFSWDPPAMATYVAGKWNKATDGDLIAKLRNAFNLPTVYDRMNGYSEALTSVALTLNPDRLIEEVMGEVNSAGYVVSVDDFRKVLTEHILYPIGDNGPRKKIREMVKRGTGEVVDLVCTKVACNSKEKGLLYHIFIHGMCKRAFNLLERFMKTSTPAERKARLSSTEGSFRRHNMPFSRQNTVDSLPSSDDDSDTDTIMTATSPAQPPVVASAAAVSDANTGNSSKRKDMSSAASSAKTAPKVGRADIRSDSASSSRTGGASVNASSSDSDTGSAVDTPEKAALKRPLFKGQRMVTQPAVALRQQPPRTAKAQTSRLR